MSKIMKRQALKGASKTRSIQIRASQSDDTEELDFVIVSNDNGGIRYDWDMGGYYIEVLDVKGANLDRLNTFFKDHLRSVDSAIGRISRKSVGEVVRASVTFDDDGESVKRKYLNGTLTDVSVGYLINKYTVEEREGEPDIVTVTDYDIHELSAVGIGFDGGAKHERGAGMLTQEQMDELSKELDHIESILK